MRLGLYLGYSGPNINLPTELVKEADRIGYYICWSAEAYGSDAVSPLAWLGPQTKQIRLGTAIMQMAARTPSSTAMTAMTIDQLSGERFVLGLGVSGPLVVEGWHGQPYARPLARTREYIEIVRAIFRREMPLEYDGQYYQIPYKASGSTGYGRPLKSILRNRSDLPIYLAAIGPKNVALAAEIADGWLPIFFIPEYYQETFAASVSSGLAAASKQQSELDISPSVMVVLGDDLESCWNIVKPMLALYIGGMGARGNNYYYDLVCRYGYEESATKIQQLYLDGQKMEAIECVPEALVDEVSLCGSKERIRDRFSRWKKVPITTLNIITFDVEVIRLMAELVL